MKRSPHTSAIAVVAAILVACSSNTASSQQTGFGSKPDLPAPQKSLIPTVNVATAKGWPAGSKPTPAVGLSVEALASGLDHPRWLHVLPNGDVLVAETNAPPKADGSAAMRSVFLTGLNSPFGMALVGDSLYVANTDALMRFPYRTGDLKITAPGTKILDLPAYPLNHHWTKDVVASPDGRRLYVSVGSNSNVGESGMDKEVGRAAIWEVDPATRSHRIFASGLRNPNGLSWQHASGELWAAVNERDELGNDLVPDYMTSIKDGGFYGWPYSYFGQHVDVRVKPQRPELVAKALVPDYALGAHTASLGLTFYTGDALGTHYSGGAFVGQHGSWNRKPRSGYKVIFVPFAGGKPNGMPEDVLTGFVSQNGEAYGRPVGVAIDKAGALLVADDVGNVVWRVTKVEQ